MHALGGRVRRPDGLGLRRRAAGAHRHRPHRRRHPRSRQVRHPLHERVAAAAVPRQGRPVPRLSFAIHLDGQERTHDYVTQSPGCFKKVIEASRLALSRGYRVNANCTVFAESDIDEIAELFRHLKQDVGFHNILVSPGFDFDQTGNDFFLRRRQVIERFQKLLSLVKEEWFGNSQLYLDFLKGELELTCTAWGTRPGRRRAGRDPATCSATLTIRPTAS